MSDYSRYLNSETQSSKFIEEYAGNPNITYFNSGWNTKDKRHTHFRYSYVHVSGKGDLKVDNTNADVLRNMIIGISQNYQYSDIITITQKDCILLKLSVRDIYMIGNYTPRDGEFCIKLSDLLCIPNFVIVLEELKINISNPESQLNFYADGFYVSTDMKTYKYTACSFPCVSYQVLNIDTNKEFSFDGMDDNIAIKNIYVYRLKHLTKKYIKNVYFVEPFDKKIYFKPSDSPLSDINSNIEYHYRYITKDSFEIPVIQQYCGTLLPNNSRKLFVESSKNEKIRVIVCYNNVYQHASNHIDLNYKKLFKSDKLKIFDQYMKNTNDQYVIKQIIDNKWSNPFTQKSDMLAYEGYWFSKSNENELYPIPISSKEQVDKEFLDKLDKKIITLNYDQNMGGSECRLCDKITGGDEYYFTHNNMQIRFPNGLVHYYKEHNVHPSQEFYDIIMSED